MTQLCPLFVKPCLPPFRKLRHRSICSQDFARHVKLKVFIRALSVSVAANERSFSRAKAVISYLLPVALIIPSFSDIHVTLIATYLFVSPLFPVSHQKLPTKLPGNKPVFPFRSSVPLYQPSCRFFVTYTTSPTRSSNSASC